MGVLAWGDALAEACGVTGSALDAWVCCNAARVGVWTTFAPSQGLFAQPFATNCTGRPVMVLEQTAHCRRTKARAVSWVNAHESDVNRSRAGRAVPALALLQARRRSARRLPSGLAMTPEQLVATKTLALLLTSRVNSPQMPRVVGGRDIEPGVAFDQAPGSRRRARTSEVGGANMRACAAPQGSRQR